MMTCDDVLKKIRDRVLDGTNERAAVVYYIKILEERERVIREHYLSAEEQRHLIQSNPPKWNRWLRCVLQEKMRREPDMTNPFLVLEYTGRILIQLSGANFDGCDLSPVALKYADLTGCSFQHANLEGSYFEDCEFHDVSFKSANLRHVFMWISSFHNVDFDNADISYAEGDVNFLDNVRLGGACVKHNSLRATNYSTFPGRLINGTGTHREGMRGRIIQQGAQAKFFPFSRILDNVDALT